MTMLRRKKNVYQGVISTTTVDEIAVEIVKRKRRQVRAPRVARDAEEDRS